VRKLNFCRSSFFFFFFPRKSWCLIFSWRSPCTWICAAFSMYPRCRLAPMYFRIRFVLPPPPSTKVRCVKKSCDQRAVVFRLSLLLSSFFFFLPSLFHFIDTLQTLHFGRGLLSFPPRNEYPWEHRLKVLTMLNNVSISFPMPRSWINRGIVDQSSLFSFLLSPSKNSVRT